MKDSKKRNASPILLVAINARYTHPNLGVRSLIANMPMLRPRLLECEIKQAPETIMRQIQQQPPCIVAIGVYIWNRSIVEKLIPLIRITLPKTKIILGGPEVSFDLGSKLAGSADCLICGEAENAFPDICQKMIAGEPFPRIVHAPSPLLHNLAIPFHEYSNEDIANRNVYIETSRGCPCSCSFCLSSLNDGVRYYDLNKVFAALDQLCQRGARRFRFVDRSFNLAGDHAIQILNYFSCKNIKNLFLHLEVVPEILPASFRKTLLTLPPGCLHIETGIQSLNPDVLKTVNRISNPDAALEGIHWLAHVANAQVHADLIAGLPGEDLTSFAQGLQKLFAHDPSEIQLGTLKNLPGTGLEDFPGMAFSTTPPYEVICSDKMTEDDLQTVKRFAAHWERVMNRKLFPRTTRLLLNQQDVWSTFNAFSLAMENKHGRYGMGLVEIAKVLFDYLKEHSIHRESDILAALYHDYLAGGKRINVPKFMKPAKEAHARISARY